MKTLFIQVNSKLCGIAVYHIGRKVAEDFKAKMRIVFDELLPQWNYRAIPARTFI